MDRPDSHIPVITARAFQPSDFYTCLIKGTRFFHSNEYDKAIEEWEKATKLRNDRAGTATLPHTHDFKGQLGDVPLVGLLDIISSRVQSGVAVVTSDYAYKEIFFKEGWIVFGRTTRSDERIGEFLVKRGMIRPANLDALANTAKREGVRLGRYLVTNGLLSEKELNELLDFQIREILCDLFSWRQGGFHFTERDVTDEDVIVGYTPLDLALLAARRALDFSTFRKMIPNNKVIFRVPPDIEADKEEAAVKLDANERFIFSLIDGRRSIDQLIKFSGNDEISTIDILYRLMLKGLIKRTKDIASYEDTEFREVSRFLRTFFEISRMISETLNDQLGLQAAEILDRARKNLPDGYRNVFKGIPMDRDTPWDTNKMLRNISLYYPEPSERLVFIDAFSEFITNIMSELSRFLGKLLTKTVIADIDKVRMDIFRFYPDSALKRRVLAALDKIVAQFS
jgi:hypothetical protein